MMEWFCPCPQKPLEQRKGTPSYCGLSLLDTNLNFFNFLRAVPKKRASKTKPSKSPCNQLQMQTSTSYIFPSNTQNSEGCEVAFGCSHKAFRLHYWMFYLLLCVLPSLLTASLSAANNKWHIKIYPTPAKIIHTLEHNNHTFENLKKIPKNTK